MPPKPSPRGWVPGAHHADDIWVDGLNEDPPGAPHTLHQLVERCPLHLLPLQVSHTVQEVKHHPTLGQLPAQQFMQLRGRHIWGGVRGMRLGPRCHSSGEGQTLLMPRAGPPLPPEPRRLSSPLLAESKRLLSHPPFLQGKGTSSLLPNPDLKGMMA